MRKTDAAQGDLDLGDRPVQLPLALGPPVDPEVLKMRELRDRAVRGWLLLRKKLGRTVH